MNFFNGVNNPMICGWYVISVNKMLIIIIIVIIIIIITIIIIIIIILRTYLKNGDIFYSSLLSVNSISLLQGLDSGCGLEE